ncbi:MAG: CopD family protein [Nitrososphaerales archaeon]
MSILDIAILWIHLFSAVIFVGGSFFIWLVVMPASHLFAKDEAERTQIIGKIAKQFGKITNPTLVVLILSGIYNATWYLPSFNSLLAFQNYGAQVLLVKVVLVAVLVVLIYVHGVYYGRKIVALAQNHDIEGLKAVRRKSRLVSIANLVLMVLILLLAVMLQMPP